MNSVIIDNISNINEVNIKGLFEFTNPSGSLSYRNKLIPEYNYFYRYLPNNKIQIFFSKYVTDTNIININNNYYILNNNHSYDLITPQPSRTKLRDLLRSHAAMRVFIQEKKRITNFKHNDNKWLKYNNTTLLLTKLPKNTIKIEYLNNDNQWTELKEQNIIHYTNSHHEQIIYSYSTNHCFLRFITKAENDYFNNNYLSIIYHYYKPNYPYRVNYLVESVNINKNIYKYPLIEKYPEKYSTINQPRHLPISLDAILICK